METEEDAPQETDAPKTGLDLETQQVGAEQPDRVEAATARVFAGDERGSAWETCTWWLWQQSAAASPVIACWQWLWQQSSAIWIFPTPF